MLAAGGPYQAPSGNSGAGIRSAPVPHTDSKGKPTLRSDPAVRSASPRSRWRCPRNGRSPRTRLELQRSTDKIAQLCKFLCRVLQSPVVDIFSRTTAFCSLRSEYFLRAGQTDRERLALCWAALHATGMHVDIPEGLTKQVWAYRAMLDSKVDELIAVAVANLVQSGLEQLNLDSITRWNGAVDLTIHRVALLLTEEPAAVADMVLPLHRLSSRTPDDIIAREFVLFAISPEYFSLRQQLGLAVRDFNLSGSAEGASGKGWLR